MMIPSLVLVLAASPMTLDEVRTASRQNVDALRAELDVSRAESGEKLARAAILPQVNLSASAAETWAGPQRTFSTVPRLAPDGTITFEQSSVDTPGFTRSNFNLQLQVRQLLYDGGKWWTAMAQAGAQREAARGQLEEQQLASTLEAERRFYELVRAQLTLKVLEATVERSVAQVERAKSLYQAARVQRREVLDAQVNLGNDRISVLRQGQTIQGAQVDLLKWLGQPVREVEVTPPAAIDEKVDPALAPAADEALKHARESRPLVRALEKQVEAAQAGVTIARAEYLPKVSVNATYNRGSPTADPFFTDLTKQNALSAGLSISWDLFSGFGTDAQVEQSRVELRRTELEQQQQLVELEGEIRRAVKALETQVAVAKIAAENLALARNQLQLEEERYAAGAGSSLDVRNAQIKVTQAELTQLTGRIDVEIARAALTRLTGGAAEEKP